MSELEPLGLRCPQALCITGTLQGGQGQPWWEGWEVSSRESKTLGQEDPPTADLGLHVDILGTPRHCHLGAETRGDSNSGGRTPESEKLLCCITKFLAPSCLPRGVLAPASCTPHKGESWAGPHMAVCPTVGPGV